MERKKEKSCVNYWVLRVKICWGSFVSLTCYRHVCVYFSAVQCSIPCVLLTDLTALSKCLELCTVTHTTLMTPATIKATTIFWEQSEQAPVIWVQSSLNLLRPEKCHRVNECLYLRRHLELCSCAECCARRHLLTTVACMSLKENKKSFRIVCSKEEEVITPGS